MTPLTFNCANHPHEELEWRFDSVYNRFLIEGCSECEVELNKDNDDAVADVEAAGYEVGRQDGYDEGYDEGRAVGSDD
jgi:flagellar biosynthesis/type III secretory pathway protein FliH